MQTHKKCPKCQETKPIVEFGFLKPNSKGVIYVKSRCKKCASLVAREYQKNNKDNWYKYLVQYRKTRIGQLSHLRTKAKTLGLSNFEADKVVEEFKKSNGTCAICKKIPTHARNAERLSIDHCHKTMTFRGFLCHQCNVMLGYAFDDENILAAAIDYLKVHKLNNS